MACLPGPAIAQSYLDQNPDEVFETVYARLGIKLPVRVARDPQIWLTLGVLKREACDQQALNDLAILLNRGSYRREAAEAQYRFVRECGAPMIALHRSVDTFLKLSDFPKAVEVADEFVRRDPTNFDAHYLRGAAFQSLEDHHRALSDFATAVALVGADKRKISAEVFSRMANAYAKLGQFCEAPTPILMWIAIDPLSRDNDRSRKIIEDFEKQGNCAASKGNARQRYALQGQNRTILAKVDINGVRGTFIIDTGASYVAIKSLFAQRAKVSLTNATDITVNTANGAVKAKLSKADKVSLGKLQAGNVPVVVQTNDDKIYGAGIDGLLGMSFLSRFEMQMAGGFLEIRTRKPR